MKRPAIASARQFATDTKGSLTIFSIFLFILILMISGLAVDLMRHETRRVAVQNALDAAVLAAASATQAGDAETVIRSHLERSGIDPASVTVTTSAVDGVTRAFASVDVTTDTMFMDLMGIETLSSVPGANAAETVTKVEISLILDFTSSMKSQGRRAALIAAVDDFVNVVYQLDCSTGTCSQPDPDADITINVVPYGGYVNPGRRMAGLLGLDRWHEYSSCGVIPSSSYSNTQLPHGSIAQLPHFYSWNLQDLPAFQEFGWCPQDDNTILYAANHPQAIKDYIRTLNLNDGTGSQIGMKWGMALLDPTSRDEFNTLISDGIVSNTQGNTSGTFPEDYAVNVMKVAVLMTDGGITMQTVPLDFEFEWFYDEENADLYETERTEALERYGSFMMEDGEFVLDDDGNAIPRPRVDIEYSVPNSERIQARSEAYISRDDAIDDLEAQCNLARIPKDSGTEQVTVYTVRFLESAQWTEDYMKPCATEDYFYFDVKQISDLTGAFASIASHINNRRLSLVN